MAVGCHADVHVHTVSKLVHKPVLSSTSQTSFQVLPVAMQENALVLHDGKSMAAQLLVNQTAVFTHCKARQGSVWPDETVYNRIIATAHPGQSKMCFSNDSIYLMLGNMATAKARQCLEPESSNAFIPRYFDRCLSKRMSYTETFEQNVA